MKKAILIILILTVSVFAPSCSEDEVKPKPTKCGPLSILAIVGAQCRDGTDFIDDSFSGLESCDSNGGINFYWCRY